ncbi:MAG TPA: helix-turn-helix domain-containing protein, partial [Polyangiaceae bacterium]|nr:helix-turn-helix domain-containing protein [Polyangiaceae bacterium]
GRVGWHANAAPALVVGLDDSFAIHAEAAPWLRAREVYVEAGCRHELDCGDARVLVLYLAPGKLDARQFRARWALPSGELLSLPPQHAGREQALALAAGQLPLDLLTTGIDRWLGGPAPAALCDDARSDSLARQLLVEPESQAPRVTPALPELSPSRQRHVFHEHTGISLRALRRWQRMRAVGRRLAAGSNLTRAAHALDFTDSAHLSRDFRASFGLPPSRIFGRCTVTHDHCR